MVLKNLGRIDVLEKYFTHGQDWLDLNPVQKNDACA